MKLQVASCLWFGNNNSILGRGRFFAMLLLSDLWKEGSGLISHQQLAPAAGVSTGIQRRRKALRPVAGGKVPRSKCCFLPAEFKRVLQLEACHTGSGAYLQLCAVVDFIRHIHSLKPVVVCEDFELLINL